MRTKIPWLVAALLLCPLGAQDEPAKPASTPEARLEQLQAEQVAIVKAWREDMQQQAEAAKKDPSKPMRAMRMRPDFSALRAKYVAAADEFPAAAVDFLMPALDYSEKPAEYREVIDRLVTGHLDDPAIAPLGATLSRISRLLGDDYIADVTAKIEAHGKNLRLLGWIAFTRYQPVFENESPKSEAFVEAKNLVTAAVGKAGDARLKAQLESLLAEKETFGLGMVAPDIDGIDLDGVAFKLSDYKGKVIFLDFWGDW